MLCYYCCDSNENNITSTSCGGSSIGSIGNLSSYDMRNWRNSKREIRLLLSKQEMHYLMRNLHTYGSIYINRFAMEQSVYATPNDASTYMIQFVVAVLFKFPLFIFSGDQQLAIVRKNSHNKNNTGHRYRYHWAKRCHWHLHFYRETFVHILRMWNGIMSVQSFFSFASIDKSKSISCWLTKRQLVVIWTMENRKTIKQYIAWALHIAYFDFPHNRSIGLRQSLHIHHMHTVYMHLCII